MALKNWIIVISRILEESGSRNASLTGLTDRESDALTKELNDEYILIKRGDAERVVFVEGAIPPEGTLTCDIQSVDPDADDFLTDPYPNNA